MRKIEVRVLDEGLVGDLEMSSEDLDRLFSGEVRLYCTRCHATTWHTRVRPRPPHKPVKATYIPRARPKTFRCQDCGTISKLKRA